jgi:hypothetical protein
MMVLYDPNMPMTLHENTEQVVIQRITWEDALRLLYKRSTDFSISLILQAALWSCFLLSL